MHHRKWIVWGCMHVRVWPVGDGETVSCGGRGHGNARSVEMVS